jgi:ribose transport system ATP-binding protein
VRVATYSGAASPLERWADGAGLVSEDRKAEGLAAGLGVADNLTLTRLQPFGSFGVVWPARQRAAANRWISQLGIRCSGAAQPAIELSGGNQQKVALARLLHHDVDLLILDEPTRGIDVGSKAQIYALIDALVAERLPRRAGGTEVSGRDGGAREGRRSPGGTEVPGRDGGRPKAVLIVSSYLPELLGLCDRIAVMRRGRLGPARPVSEVTEHSLMMEATGAVTAA